MHDRRYYHRNMICSFLGIHESFRSPCKWRKDELIADLTCLCIWYEIRTHTWVLVYLTMRGEGERWEQQWTWSSLLFWYEADVQYKGVLILFISNHIRKKLQEAGNLHARASIFTKWWYLNLAPINNDILVSFVVRVIRVGGLCLL